MAITADWQANLRAVTMGAGTAYECTGPITGLGIPSARTSDVERGDRAGAVGGRDTLPRRVLTVPLAVVGSGPADAWALLEALKVAWAEAEDPNAEEPFDLRLPGLDGRRFYGRPRGLDDDTTLMRAGHIAALGTFEALDPYGYGATEAAIGAPPTLDVDNVGPAPTDRAVLVIVGDGGTPQISNAARDDDDITWRAPLAAAAIRTIDLRRRTVIDDAGTAHDDEVAPGSLWFDLAPGVNTLGVVGVASLDVDWLPAYR